MTIARADKCYSGAECQPRRGMIHARHDTLDSNLVRCGCGASSASVAEVGAFAAGGIRWGLMLGRSSLRDDCTAVLGLGSCRQTHFAHCVRSVQTDGDKSDNEARCARRPQSCAPRRPTNCPPAGTACREIHRCAPSKGTTVVAKPRAGRCGRACEAPRSAGLVAARASALRDLTSPRLSERSERSERSEFAAGHETEYFARTQTVPADCLCLAKGLGLWPSPRAVGPQGRPPKWRARTGPPAALLAPTSASGNSNTESRRTWIHKR